jgi:hypothetical protein
MAFVGFIVHFFLLSSILQQQKTEVDPQGRGLETKNHKVGEDWKNMEAMLQKDQKVQNSYQCGA